MREGEERREKRRREQEGEGEEEREGGDEVRKGMRRGEERRGEEREGRHLPQQGTGTVRRGRQMSLRH